VGKANIVLIGAGSTSFGVNMLADLFSLRRELAGSHIALCDVNAAKLARMTRLAERMNESTGAGFCIAGATDHRKVLDGAEFVIVSAEVDRLERWRLDWQIPFRYGIRHVLGENGGPGGLSHALRTIDLVLGIARDVERQAPEAYLINFTNPLPRVCLALTRYTRLKVIGLCHQINKGYYIVGRVLGLVPDGSDHFPSPSVTHKLREQLDLQTAGLNHFTWIQSMRERATGRDLYPEFRARLRDLDPSFEPLSRRLFDAFGLFPASGDGHLGEYLAYAHETSDLKGFDFDGYASYACELDARVERASTSGEALDEFLRWQSGERGAQVVDAIVNNRHAYEEVLNVVNGGALPGLPDWAIVETPGVLGADGAHALRVPALPPAITAMLNRQVAIQDRVVEAAVHGDRQAALQALLLDPLTASYGDAVKLLDELLAVHADYLPRFSGAKATAE
jgi:alpha-galactosidase